nr:hypothetical protein [Pleurocapsa sp. PCC 7319]
MDKIVSEYCYTTYIPFKRCREKSESGKTTLNNLRLIIQPTIIFWMIIPWLDVFPNRSLLLGKERLIATMNQFSFYLPDG